MSLIDAVFPARKLNRIRILVTYAGFKQWKYENWKYWYNSRAGNTIIRLARFNLKGKDSCIKMEKQFPYKNGKSFHIKMEKQFPYKNGETLKDSSYLCVSYEKREPIPIASMKHWLNKFSI